MSARLPPARLDALFQQHRFTGVLHFAALSLVGESMQQPLMYLGDNTINGLVA